MFEFLFYPHNFSAEFIYIFDNPYIINVDYNLYMFSFSPSIAIQGPFFTEGRSFWILNNLVSYNLLFELKFLQQPITFYSNFFYMPYG